MTKETHYFVHCMHADGRSVGFAGLDKDAAKKTAESWSKDGYECKITSDASKKVVSYATTSPRRKIEREEHTQWVELCQELKKRGAVTEDDLKSSVQLLDTPGQWLLNMIRVWGNLRAQLGVSDYEE